MFSKKRYCKGTVMIKTISPNLRQLEAESIHIIREVAAESSIRSCCTHWQLTQRHAASGARKVFYPGTLPFPLLHALIPVEIVRCNAFRDRTANAYGCELLVHKNPEGGDGHQIRSFTVALNTPTL